MRDIRKFISSLLGALVFTALACIVLHELGHILVAVICGAKISNFGILPVHISYIGGKFDQIRYCLLNASGMLLQVLVCLLFILIYNRNIKNMFYNWFSVIFVVITAFTVVPWIIVPLIFIYSIPPAGDDVTKFLIISRWNPPIVIVCAVFLILVLLILALCKGIFKSNIRMIKEVWKK